VGVSTTTSTTFQPKINATTPSIPAGTYRIGVSYGWNHDGVQDDFEAQLRLDGVVQGEIHKEEPSEAGGAFGSTGTDQRFYAYRVFYVTLTSGSHTMVLEYRTDTALVASSIWGAVIELWRAE
jgi:hypothetical protein